MNVLRVTVALAALPALAQPPSPPQAPRAFEVASIKPSGPNSGHSSGGGPGTSDPGRFYSHGESLHLLILIAYQVQDFQVESKITLDRQTFDLDAKVPEGATKEQFHEMLKNLLAERFHLKLHMISRVFPSYALVVARNGPKLIESTGKPHPPPNPEPGVPAGEGFPEIPPGIARIAANYTTHGGFEVVHLIARQKPMSLLARMLETSVDNRPIVDQTGLTANYDFTLAYSRELPNAAPGSHTEPSGLPDLPTALQQQLGLQLIEKRLPFDVLIIDSADRLPTEN